MTWKQWFTSMVIVGMVGAPAAWAQQQTNPGNGFALSPAPASNPDTAMNAENESIALRGHLSTIPQGTMMMVRMEQPISSYSSNVGDPVTAAVETDVFINNQLAIPAGSQVLGSVSGVQKAGKVRTNGELEMQFNVIRTPNGYTMPMQGHIVTGDNTGVIRGDTEQAQVLKTLGTAVGSTAAGTLMGTAAGSLLGSAGGGALFGVAAGGIAGITYAVLKEGKQVTIPSGARMSIVLDQPVAIN